MASKKEIEFLEQSNLIENVFSPEALVDAEAAWEYAKSVKQMTLADVLHIHKLLMQNLNPRIAGRVRDCDVYIGGKRKIFISESLLKAEITDWCERANASLVDADALTAEERAELAKADHVAYEGLHPQEDGNGRTGRILYNWQREKLGIPIHVIHADYMRGKKNSEQMDYYSWFKNN